MYEKKIYFTDQQHKNLYKATHHKDEWRFRGADADWKCSYDAEKGKLVNDKDRIGFKNTAFGAIICGPFVFSIEPEKDSDCICVTMAHVCSFANFDDSYEDWPGGEMMVCIMDYEPEDVTENRDETLSNLLRYVDDFIKNTKLNNEFYARDLVKIPTIHWDKYF